MEIKLDELNNQKIRNTGGKTIKMGMSDKAHGMLFNMFTETIYQNPIGSIVREITSNCFDSHIEAKKENSSNPVIIKRSYDKVANVHYISFIDKGIGMSPERVEKIYSQYFESTKRENNDEIGGFGIGGKTPLAYKRISFNENGESIEDSSFFVITRYNGVEYQYSIFKGQHSPEINLLFETSTKEENGTEIRIPVLEKDWSKFEQEIERQLYYFENIVYVGFDNKDFNDYKIYKGQNFLYRGERYSRYIHVCLGKVAYVLSFNDLGLESYDYNIPVALKFNIGEIPVTPNREALRYTPESIQIIKDKLELVKEELINKLSVQYNNVRTIEDYYAAKEDFGYVTFKDQNKLNIKEWIDKKKVDFTNFKYNELPSIPSTSNILKYFYNIHEYGKARGWNRSVKFLEVNNWLYQCKGEFDRKVIKQSYLNHLHDKNFVIMKPYTFKYITETEKHWNGLKLTFGIEKDLNAGSWNQPTNIVVQLEEKKAKSLIRALFNDIHAWVTKNVQSYDDLDVPQDFIDARKQERLSKEIMETTIPVNSAGSYSSKGRIKIADIVGYQGKIFWGVTDEEQRVADGRALYVSMFGSDHVDSVYSYYKRFNKGRGILFITVAKNNAKYMKMCPNAYHIDMLYPLMLRRKMVNPIDILAANDYLDKIDELDSIYRNETFDSINKVVKEYWDAIKAEKEELKPYRKYDDANLNHDLITKYVDLNKMKGKLVIKTERKLNYLFEVEDKNKKMLEWVNLPYYADEANFTENRYSGLVEMLKKVMVF